MWAAYKRGIFDGEEAIPKDLDVTDFSHSVMGLAVKHAMEGNRFECMLAKTKHGVIPVGVFAATRTARGHWSLHARWFPEATPRLRLGGAVKAVSDLKKSSMVLIESRPENFGFFRHLCKYGLLRVVGHVRGYFGSEPMYLFQSV